MRQNWDWQRDYTLIGMVLPAGLGGAGWWAATEWVRAIEVGRVQVRRAPERNRGEDRLPDRISRHLSAFVRQYIRCRATRSHLAVDRNSRAHSSWRRTRPCCVRACHALPAAPGNRSFPFFFECALRCNRCSRRAAGARAVGAEQRFGGMAPVGCARLA